MISKINKILIIGFLLVCNINYTMGQSDWKLGAEKDGIRIYTSVVKNSKIKAIKVECDLFATPSQLVALLLDVTTAPEWVYHTKSCALIKQVSPSELYYYSEVNLPWPLANRDFVVHLKVTQNPDSKMIIIDGPAVPGFAPVKNGVVRISHSNGKWIITPLGNKQIRVEYTIYVDPGGSIPSWLVNTFATEGPMETFNSLKLHLQMPTYQNADLAFIKN